MRGLPAGLVRSTETHASFVCWKSCHGFQVIELLVIADVEPRGVASGLEVPGLVTALAQGIVHYVALALVFHHRLVEDLQRPAPRYLATKLCDEGVLLYCDIGRLGGIRGEIVQLVGIRRRVYELVGPSADHHDRSDCAFGEIFAQHFSGGRADSLQGWQQAATVRARGVGRSRSIA